MDGTFGEALKWIAGGGSFGTLLAIYYIWKIEPRLRSMENTTLREQRIKLLELSVQLSQAPLLHAEAMHMVTEVEATIKKNNVND